jgi:hypothetical protein
MLGNYNNAVEGVPAKLLRAAVELCLSVPGSCPPLDLALANSPCLLPTIPPAPGGRDPSWGGRHLLLGLLGHLAALQGRPGAAALAGCLVDTYLTSVERMVASSDFWRRRDSGAAMAGLVEAVGAAGQEAVHRWVLHQPEHQPLVEGLLRRVTGPAPAALLPMVRARLLHLRAELAAGPPAFSWHQPDAVVKDHPKVQEFFRGPLESFTYKYPDITSIRHAENWATKHEENDQGTSATYTPGWPSKQGRSKAARNRETPDAFVEIEKIRGGEAEMARKHAKLHAKLAEEHKRLVACLPPAEQPAAEVTWTEATTEILDSDSDSE